ncbi:hypothetical protein MKW92_045667, partial [Papaver armeniacum]
EVVALKKKLTSSQGILTKALKERDSPSRQFSTSSRLVVEVSQERDELMRAKEELEHSNLVLDQEYQSFAEGVERKYSKSSQLKKWG